MWFFKVFPSHTPPPLTHPLTPAPTLTPMDRDTPPTDQNVLNIMRFWARVPPTKGNSGPTTSLYLHFFYRGREFIMNHLDMNDVSCYWQKLLKRYAKLTKWKPTKNKDLKQIHAKPGRDELWWQQNVLEKCNHGSSYNYPYRVQKTIDFFEICVDIFARIFVSALTNSNLLLLQGILGAYKLLLCAKMSFFHLESVPYVCTLLNTWFVITRICFVFSLIILCIRNYVHVIKGLCEECDIFNW